MQPEKQNKAIQTITETGLWGVVGIIGGALCGPGQACLLVLARPRVSLASMTLGPVINWAIEQHGETVTWKPQRVRLGHLFLALGTERPFLYAFKLCSGYVTFTLG